ncbi:hypothetical protein KFK09_024129 [Dendrobium nobile]|uniref:Uncharacterized protein n=1 Tax=Dendrobium nobile TaxID=94219 RepID=A0A8T3AD11_DENNO|nr:hypothetical protein KFK09_024129 [Dendrobium nobile]
MSLRDRGHFKYLFGSTSRCMPRSPNKYLKLSIHIFFCAKEYKYLFSKVYAGDLLNVKDTIFSNKPRLKGQEKDFCGYTLLQN